MQNSEKLIEKIDKYNKKKMQNIIKNKNKIMDKYYKK